MSLQWNLPTPHLFAMSLQGLLPGRSRQSRLEQEARAAQILDTYGNDILRFAYSYVHNLADAQDILQEVLLKALHKAPEFATQKAMKAWLLQVTANQARSHLRWKARHNTVSLDDLQEFYLKDDPDLSFVWKAVKRLSTEDRSIIHLFYQEDCSTKEIALILDMNESTVRSHLSRARAKLKTILEKEDDFCEV